VFIPPSTMNRVTHHKVKSKSKSKLSYDRRSVGQSILFRDAEPVTISSFSLKLSSYSRGLAIIGIWYVALKFLPIMCEFMCLRCSTECAEEEMCMTSLHLPRRRHPSSRSNDGEESVLDRVQYINPTPGCERLALSNNGKQA
jgi:hypothetical protein